MRNFVKSSFIERKKLLFVKFDLLPSFSKYKKYCTPFLYLFHRQIKCTLCWNLGLLIKNKKLYILDYFTKNKRFVNYIF